MDIKEILGPDEQILLETNQKRAVPGGKSICPSKILVTTERIIWQDAKWLGLHKEFVDFHFTDIMNVTMKKGVFSSDIIITSRFQGEQTIHAVPTGDTKQIEKIVSEGIRRYRFGYGGPHYDMGYGYPGGEPGEWGLRRK
jgi:hypothetical protein